MITDWKPILPDDPAHQAGKVKFAADAYGVDDMRDLPTTGPDSHAVPTHWTMERIPNANVIGSRFIATKEPHA
jgi:hypothetical protein